MSTSNLAEPPSHVKLRRWPEGCTPCPPVREAVPVALFRAYLSHADWWPRRADGRVDRSRVLWELGRYLVSDVNSFGVDRGLELYEFNADDLARILQWADEQFVGRKYTDRPDAAHQYGRIVDRWVDVYLNRHADVLVARAQQQWQQAQPKTEPLVEVSS